MFIGDIMSLIQYSLKRCYVPAALAVGIYPQTNQEFAMVSVTHPAIFPRYTLSHVNNHSSMVVQSDLTYLDWKLRDKLKEHRLLSLRANYNEYLLQISPPLPDSDIDFF